MCERMVRVTMAAAWLIVGPPGAVAAPSTPAPESPQQHDHEAGKPSADYPRDLLDELDTVRQATSRFRDHEVAVAEGYELVGGDAPLMGEHWVRRDLTDRPFDLAVPSTLQYLRVDGAYLLTGVAYTVYRAPGDPLPEGFAGDHDAWHLHDLMKISMAATEGRPLLRWITERRIANGRTQWDEARPELTMVHAWTGLDNPDGVFAQEHRLIPYARLGLPLAWGVSASTDAALGAALLGDGACDLEVRRTGFMAAADRRQRRDLGRACAAAATVVGARLAGVLPAGRGDDDGEAFNETAERAWRGYEARRAEILTEAQIERLAAGIEHPPGAGHQR